MKKRENIIVLCAGIFGLLLFVVNVGLYIGKTKFSDLKDERNNFQNNLHLRLRRQTNDSLNRNEVPVFENIQITNINDKNYDGNYTTGQNSTSFTIRPVTSQQSIDQTTKPNSESNYINESKIEAKSQLETTVEPNSEPEATSESTTEPETTVEPKSQPETTFEPKSEPETTIEQSSEPQITSEPKSEPETTVEPKFEPNSEPETTYKPKSEPETTPEPKSEPETTAEPKSEPETTIEPKSEPETTTEPISQPETTHEPKSEPETTVEPKSEPETTAEPKSEPETTPEPKSEPETTSEPKSEPETTSEPNSEPETTSEPKSEPETTSEPNSEPETTSEPKSEPETTAEPKSEPETSYEPRSEPETTSEPELEPGSEPEGGPSFPEPVPQWDIAMQEYQWGWDFLVYLFGVLFLILGLYSIFNIIRLWRIEHLLSRNYFVTLNVLVMIKCFMRGLYLVIDAHNRNGTFHVVLNYFLYSTAYPCLTSAFSILFYALLLATRVRVLSTKIQKLSLLIGIIVFHFTLSIVTDFVVGYFFNARILLLVCQFFYVVWGTILFVGFFYIFSRLQKAAANRARNTTIMTNNSVSLDQRKSSKRKSKNQYTLSTSVKVTLVAAIFGLTCVILEVYGIFGVYKLYMDGHIPDPWPFFSYQFLLRLVELCMCGLMMYVASQPIMLRRNSSSSIFSNLYHTLKRFFCIPRDDKIFDSEPSSIANSNALVLLSPSDSFDKKHTVVNFNLKENGEKTGMKKESSHLVIKDGLVRFKAEEDSITGSEIGTSLPDLVHGTIINGKSNSFSEIDTGVYNKGFKENEMDRNMKKLHRSDTAQSEFLKHSIDFEKISVGTFGTDLTRPLSSINLANSLEWEFEQAYERSFAHGNDSGSTRSLPSDLSASSVSNCRVKLLSDVSPYQNRNNSVFVYEDSESTFCKDSPSNKPLIKKSDESSSVTCDNVNQN